ncbi:MAG: hypothetical protein J5935_00510 [Lachnospiraceae bacterium]|nr:hypothetical protein [Lachnospiraceae bacterium]
MVTAQELRFFEEAKDMVLTFSERERHGIGMQMEKTMHAVLKNFCDPDLDHQEIPLLNYIADIFTGEEVIEIQTAQFHRLRNKLSAFLPVYPVRVVYPIPQNKWIIWVDPVTGKAGERRTSPLHGSFYTAFSELYKIRPFLKEKNLTIELLLLDVEEYRLQDGYARKGKRGSHRYDRIPLRLNDRMVLRGKEDYMQFLPPELEEPFTSADLAKTLHYRKEGFSTVLQILHDMQVVKRVGKKRNAYLYEVNDPI